MSDIHNYTLLGSVLATSIWSLVCLRKETPLQNEKPGRTEAHRLFGESRITAEGILAMEPPLEQFRSADF